MKDKSDNSENLEKPDSSDDRQEVVKRLNEMEDGFKDDTVNSSVVFPETSFGDRNACSC